ncbi:MAG: response regulator [Gemmataceae bacterium]
MVHPDYFAAFNIKVPLMMPNTPCVHLIDDEPGVRSMISTLLESIGIPVASYASADAFVHAFEPMSRGCVVVDLCMEGMNGRQLQRWLIDHDARMPVIFVTGNGDVETAVEALKDGALDFIQKPIDTRRLIEVVRRGYVCGSSGFQTTIACGFHRRTSRVAYPRGTGLDGLVDGRNYKELAEDLNVSYKTIEARRARVLRKMQAKSVAELMRLMLTR